MIAQAVRGRTWCGCAANRQRRKRICETLQRFAAEVPDGRDGAGTTSTCKKCICIVPFLVRARVGSYKLVRVEVLVRVRRDSRYTVAFRLQR